MMEHEILKAGLLGTDKYILPVMESVREIQEKIIEKNSGNEDCFLKTIAAALCFIEAAKLPTPIDCSIPVCPPEAKDYIQENFAFLISAALRDKEDILLRYFLFICKKNNKVVPAQLVPQLLNKGLSQKEFREDLSLCCGETGRWLCSLRKEWNALLMETESEGIWETGTLEGRKNYLLSLRKRDPQKARQLLETSVNAENAATRQAFVEIMKERLSLDDAPFLESLLNDKSQKVKDIALQYLRRIQGSSVNEMYLHFILRAVVVKQERYLLVGKKNVLLIDENNTVPDEIVKTGIDKLSSDKKVKDHIFILGQLLENIDPARLAQGLNIPDEELIKLFLQHPEADSLVPYLSKAAVLFSNKAWCLALLQSGNGTSVHLLDMLEEKERQPYYDLFLKASLPSFLNYLLDENYSLLPVNLAENILAELSQNPYQIDAGKYRRMALQLPEAVIPVFKKYLENNTEDYKLKYFKNQSMEMLRIIELRKIIP